MNLLQNCCCLSRLMRFERKTIRGRRYRRWSRKSMRSLSGLRACTRSSRRVAVSGLRSRWRWIRCWIFARPSSWCAALMSMRSTRPRTFTVILERLLGRLTRRRCRSRRRSWEVRPRWRRNFALWAADIESSSVSNSWWQRRVAPAQNCLRHCERGSTNQTELSWRTRAMRCGRSPRVDCKHSQWIR